MLKSFAQYATVPVINMETITHPCQELAHIMTLQEKLGDLQNTKAPLINGVTDAQLCLELVPELLLELDICHEQCAKAIEPAMYATDKAIGLAKEGAPFRQAYQQLKDNYQELAQRSPQQALHDRVSPGACANLKLSELAKRLENV